MNRLASERSPYLLQHARNPVHWWPWGTDAFNEASQSQRPVFLSIGYSTCHWCHVMERECFENNSIAHIMNRHFVNIKVDREERPDVDQQYMKFVVRTNDSGGGWPLSVFLTPEGHPFLGGTYYPPPQFSELLTAVSEVWSKNREQILQAAKQGVAIIEYNEHRPEFGDSHSIQDKSSTMASLLERTFCREHGGFSPPPKFHMPSNLLFLWRHFPEHRPFVEHTLIMMGKGGIHDHVGGGFHRYSVDRAWHVPHFEKMLYDQAQLLNVFSEAFHLNQRDTFRFCALDIIGYVKKRLTDIKNGGFYCAEDADSLPMPGSKEKQEGAFALWTKAQIDDLLGEKKSKVFCKYFGVKAEGNVPYQYDAHKTMGGMNVLHVALEEEYPGPSEIMQDDLEALRKVSRPRPHLDDKIVVAWNAYMISALVSASRYLGNNDSLELALRAGQFIRENLFIKNQLKRTWRGVASDADATSLDYCALIKAYLDLFEMTLDSSWKIWACQLQDILDERYASPAGGYYNGLFSDLLPSRNQDVNDGVEPSADSIALENLARLNLLYPEKYSYQEQLDFLSSLSPFDIPLGLNNALSLKNSVLVKLSGPNLEAVQPFKKIILENIGKDHILTLDFCTSDTTHAQICRHGVCELPLTDAKVLLQNLVKNN